MTPRPGNRLAFKLAAWWAASSSKHFQISNSRRSGVLRARYTRAVSEVPAPAAFSIQFGRSVRTARRLSRYAPRNENFVLVAFARVNLLTLGHELAVGFDCLVFRAERTPQAAVVTLHVRPNVGTFFPSLCIFGGAFLRPV